MIAIAFLPSSFKVNFGLPINQMGHKISQLDHPLQQAKIIKKVSWVAKNRFCYFIIFSSFTLVKFFLNYMFLLWYGFFILHQKRVVSLVQIFFFNCCQLSSVSFVFRMEDIHHHVLISLLKYVHKQLKKVGVLEFQISKKALFSKCK